MAPGLWFYELVRERKRTGRDAPRWSFPFQGASREAREATAFSTGTLGRFPPWACARPRTAVERPLTAESADAESQRPVEQISHASTARVYLWDGKGRKLAIDYRTFVRRNGPRVESCHPRDGTEPLFSLLSPRLENHETGGSPRRRLHSFSSLPLLLVSVRIRSRHAASARDPRLLPDTVCFPLRFFSAPG